MQATAVEAATRLHEQRAVAVPTLKSKLAEMGGLLQQHKKGKRPPMPESLFLDAHSQPLRQQHLHWGFDRLRSRETLSLRGKSSLDREQGGLKAVDFFRLESLGGAGDAELTDAAQLQRRFGQCLGLMREVHALCLKLANLEDATWRAKLMCAALADLLLVRLPLPLPPKESGGCVWAASAKPDLLDDAVAVAAVLEQCAQLMQMLAFASAALAGDDAEHWHPSLVCLGGALAAIADAVARRSANGNDGHAPVLAQLLNGWQGHLPGEAEDGGKGQRPYGVGCGAFKARTETLLMGRPELCVARKHVYAAAGASNRPRLRATPVHHARSRRAAGSSTSVGSSCLATTSSSTRRTRPSTWTPRAPRGDSSRPSRRSITHTCPT